MLICVCVCVCVRARVCVCFSLCVCLRTFCGFQTLVASWRYLQSIRKASDGCLVHRGSMKGKLLLKPGLVHENNAGEMDNGQSVIWQAARHLFCS